MIVCSPTGMAHLKMTSQYRHTIIIIIRRLTSFVGSFGLLNDVSPFHSVLNTGCPIFNIQLADILYYIVFPTFLGLPLDLTVRGVQLNIFLTVLESGILCK
jgi:hypothetical protein